MVQGWCTCSALVVVSPQSSAVVSPRLVVCDFGDTVVERFGDRTSCLDTVSESVILTATRRSPLIWAKWLQ